MDYRYEVLLNSLHCNIKLFTVSINQEHYKQPFLICSSFMQLTNENLIQIMLRMIRMKRRRMINTQRKTIYIYGNNDMEILRRKITPQVSFERLPSEQNTQTIGEIHFKESDKKAENTRLLNNMGCL